MEKKLNKYLCYFYYNNTRMCKDVVIQEDKSPNVNDVAIQHHLSTNYMRNAVFLFVGKIVAPD